MTAELELSRLSEQLYARLEAQFGTDLDLEGIIRDERRPHQGVDL